MQPVTRRQFLAGLAAGAVVAGLGTRSTAASGAGYEIYRQYEKTDLYGGGPLLLIAMASVQSSRSVAANKYDDISADGIDTFIDSLGADDIYVNDLNELDFADRNLENVFDSGVTRCGWQFELETDGVILDGYLVIAQKSRCVHVWAGVGLSAVERPFFRIVDRYMKFDATGRADLVDIVPSEYDLDGYELTSDETDSVDESGWL
jgi:hypothetical protein